MEVVQGVQLGHRATWFGGGRARPAPAPAPLPPPRTSGWRLAGKAVRLFGPWAFAADASTSHGSGGCTASNPFQNLSRRRSSKFCISPLFLTIFLGESLRKGSQHCFILRDILFRGNYVTNRCPGSARNSGSAAAGPGNGSRLVKCQRRPRHWISTEPTARRSTYRFAEPERVKQYIKIGTSFALAGFR